MLIESKIKIGPDSMLNIHQANFKSAHLLDRIALVQFQRNRSVSTKVLNSYTVSTFKIVVNTGLTHYYLFVFTVQLKYLDC